MSTTVTQAIELPYVVFKDSISTPITGAVTTESHSAYNSNILALEISGSGTFTAKAQVCQKVNDASGNILTDAQCSWTDLAVLNMNTGSKAVDMKAFGSYEVPTLGRMRVRIVFTACSGSVTVTGIFR